MKGQVRQCDGTAADSSLLDSRSQRGGTYHKVLDGRKRPIRGLWKRNERFYARLAVTDSETGKTDVRRIPLEGVTTVAQAQAELRRLQTKREDGDLPVLKQAPKFCEQLPTQHLRPLKWTARKKELFKLDDIERLCQAANRASSSWSVGESTPAGVPAPRRVEAAACCCSLTTLVRRFAFTWSMLT